VLLITAFVASLGGLWIFRNYFKPATLTTLDLEMWRQIPSAPFLIWTGTSTRRIYSSWNSEDGHEKGCLVVAETSRERSSGAVFFYQSYWGEPEERMLKMSEIHKTNDVWGFALTTPDFSGKYELRMFGDHALLKRVDVKSRWVELGARNGAIRDPVRLPSKRPYTSR
jgi:hypothetical protein